MKTEFRVMLIDDTLEVLENLKADIQKRQPIVVKGFTKEIIPIKVKVDILHVRLELLHGGTTYQITDATIEDLVAMCHEDFDFIFSDFAFIGDRTKNETLRQDLLAQRATGRKVGKNDLQGWVLHLKDIKDKVSAFETSAPEKFNFVNAHFLKHKNIIQVYTNSPEPFSSYFEGVEFPKRIEEVQSVFKESKDVDFILMHNEFSITSNIDNLFTEPQRKEYYAKLLGHRLTALIETVILRHMVLEQRVYKLGDTKSAFRILTVLGLALGAFSALMGEMLFHFLSHPLKETFEAFGWNFHQSIWGGYAIFGTLAITTFVFLSWFSVLIADKTEGFAKILTGIQKDKTGH